MSSETRPIRVAIVAPSLSQIVGGQEVQASILLARWETDDEVRATFLPTTPDLPRLIMWVNRIPYLRTIIRFPKYVISLVSSARRVDIIHAFSASFSSFLVAPFPAWIVAQLLRKPILINYRSGRASEHLARSRIARFVLRHCDAVVVPSNYLVDIFAGYGIIASVIPNIVDEHEFKYRDRNPIHPLLLCTRNFEECYGIDSVIRAFSILKTEYPQARLCLAGTGKCDEEMRRLVRELDLSEVEFTGSVSPATMPSLYDRSDLFINGSLIDNAPSSIIEAFSAGLPVVSTDAGGIPHLIRHEQNGLLSACGDWRALATNVSRLLKDQALAKKMVGNARNSARKHSWEMVRPKWTAVYQELARQPFAFPKQ